MVRSLYIIIQLTHIFKTPNNCSQRSWITSEPFSEISRNKSPTASYTSDAFSKSSLLNSKIPEKVSTDWILTLIIDH